MKRLFGGLLLGIGILIMTCSGLCSLIVIVSGVRDPTMLPLPLLFGGVPFLMGFGLFRWGRWLLRHADDPSA